MRVLWLAYGDLAQKTGGYVYDERVVLGLRALGDDVEVADPRGAPRTAVDEITAVVGDGLCVPELGPLFEGLARGPARVLLVHHLTSWEVERDDRATTAAAEARAITASDHIVVTGARTAQRLAQEYGRLRPDGPEGDMTVIPPGADRLPRLPLRPAPAGQVRLLALGSLIPRKRLHLVLEALDELSRPGVSLVAVGDASRDPAHAADLAARIERSPLLRASVRLAGVAGDDGVARALADADALVLASSLEGYGMVVTESLHAGLPVIVSRAVAEAAGVEASPAALVFDDRAGLARIIRRFCDDPSQRRALREAAIAEPLPRWDGSVAAFRAVLTRAASRRAPARAPRP